MTEKKGLIKTVTHINSTIHERIDAKFSFSIGVTGASCFGNTLVGMGKLTMGIVSLSLFTCVSALYTFGMVLAKVCALAGIYKAENAKAQYRYYAMSGVILITASVLYIAYSARLFFHPEAAAYHMYVGIGIAAFTFTELTLNIRGVFIERHNHTPLIHAIKMINLASSLICLVLTQTAILSFADANSEVVKSQANGLMGIIMGGLATLLGIVMILRIKQLERAKSEIILPKLPVNAIIEEGCTQVQASENSDRGHFDD